MKHSSSTDGKSQHHKRKININNAQVGIADITHQLNKQTKIRNRQKQDD